MKRSTIDIWVGVFVDGYGRGRMRTVNQAQPFFDTAGAEVGNYFVTARAGVSASTSFNLSDYAPFRTQEGGGQTFTLPAGLAVHNVVYLPYVKR